MRQSANASSKSSDSTVGAGKVLVLGSDTRSFLSVVRSLGRKRIEVDVAWYGSNAPALRSRYIRKAHDLPTPWDSPNTWKQEFCHLLRAEQFDLVIPCNDPSLIPLQEHQDELNKISRIYHLNDRAYSIAFDKEQSTLLAATLDIPVARSHLVSNAKQAEQVVEELGFPLILKPLRSYAPEKLQKRNRVVRVDDMEQCNKHLDIICTNGSVLVQEFFQGTGAGVEFLASEGKVLTAFQHVRLHEPGTGGGSSYRASTRLHPDLLSATKRLIEAMNYSGVGMVEFRIDLDTNQWIFIEVNGRFWGSLPLAIACGADFPYYLYRNLVHDQREFRQSYRVGLRCRNFTKDLRWYQESVAGALRARPILMILVRDIFSSLAGLLLLRERSDTLVIDDPAPAFVELWQATQEIAQRIPQKIGAKVRSCRLLRQRQRVRALQELECAKRILFVCKGNICRSPFAEYYARRIFPSSLEISSFGYYPKSGRPSPANAQTASQANGIDLTGHRSQIISQEDIDQADIVFVFDEENRRTLLERYPDARRRIYFLGCLSSEGKMQIKDPYGGQVKEFEKTYNLIEHALDSIAATVVETRMIQTS